MIKSGSTEATAAANEARQPAKLNAASSNLLTPEISSHAGISSDGSRAESAISIDIRQRVRTFKGALHRRSAEVRSIIDRPPTPDEDEVPDDVDIDPDSLKVEDYVPDIELLQPKPPESEEELSRWQEFRRLTISTSSRFYLAWVGIVSLTFVYNAFCVPFRAAFPYQTPENLWAWLLFDYIADIIYLVDMIVVKPKVRFMRAGIEILEFEETKKHYLMHSTFKLDLICVIPTDILYLVPSLRFQTLLRANRIFKYPTYGEFQQHLDTIVSNAYILRVGQTLTNMLYLIHCNSCIFYTFSWWQSPDPNNRWIHRIGTGGPYGDYIRCFYFATKLAISIGNNPTPTNVLEYIYATFAWMMGVFVFAMLLGNIRDIVANATKTKDYYRNCMDATLEHLKQLHVKKATMNKARLWYVHTWEEQGTLNEGDLINKLPKKLQTDLAISVHYRTLGKVKLFQGCDQALIRELVLKLRPVLFLPGDYVCRKGEVGKEMYIIESGLVQVVGGPNGDIVFVTLKAGSVFGEISLLAESGKNRRTADVKSQGFSFLFVLSKEDLDETIRDYPESQDLLRKKARKMMKANEKRDQKNIDAKDKLQEAVALKRGPRMAEAVVQIMNPESETTKKLMGQKEE